MKHNLDIAIQDPIWEDMKGLKSLSEKAVENTIEIANMAFKTIEKPVEISLVFMNDDAIRVLNREYRGKDKPTNVLSFAMLGADDGPDVDIVTLGDIILSYETIAREAEIYDCSIEDHTVHMIVHGCLHLMGYDHIEEDDANIMETLEIRILELMNIRNPYIQILES